MLLRLRIKGFKNLYDAEVRFGPFTCLAGINGVGKSNLFDAIHFLKLTTDHDLIEAARLIRDDRGMTGDIRDLFYRSGDFLAPWMEFEADLLTERTGEDRLRQKAEATSTLLTYRLRLSYRDGSEYGPLQIEAEELSYTKTGEAHNKIRFPVDVRAWRKEVVFNNRRTAEPYLRTERDTERRSIIKVQQDGTPGRPSPRLAEPLPKTVLSELNSTEAPTAVVARNDIAGWQLLQLEPTALRRPDTFDDKPGIGSDGSHLPMTLYRMMQANPLPGEDGADHKAAIRQRIANRLSELVDDVRDLNLLRDERRETLTLLAKLADGTEHAARSLSDGTLRFLALTLIEQGKGDGVFCLEEPENGIHPARVPAMIQLLRDIAVDPSEPPGDDNPLRQVIINTHSPSVVGEMRDDELLLVEATTHRGGVFNCESSVPTIDFAVLTNTWRAGLTGAREVQKGRVGEYLNPIRPGDYYYGRESGMVGASVKRRPRVKDRDDMQLVIPYSDVEFEH